MLLMLTMWTTTLSITQAGPHGGREREHGPAQEARVEDQRARVQAGAGEDDEAASGDTDFEAEGGKRG